MPEHRPGLGVDALGGAVVDPTANVKDLNEAASKRQDDLRDATNKLIDAKIDHLRDMQVLRADHAREIREIESKRLDAIRQVDVLAVNTAADRALQAIQALAATTTANAETLRAMVANTAATIATQTNQTVTAIIERIANLEKSSYTGMGKQAYSDPMMEDLVKKIENLGSVQKTSQGKSEGISTSWAILIGAVTLLGGIAVLLSRVIR